jgi:hypothetical protein
VSVKIIELFQLKSMDKQVSDYMYIDICYWNFFKRIIESRQKPSRENLKIFFIQSEYRMLMNAQNTSSYNKIVCMAIPFADIL